MPDIAMSANAFTDERIGSREVGMKDVPALPLDPDLAGSTVARWMGQFEKKAAWFRPGFASNAPKNPAAELRNGH